jgi:hypothetical protein
LTVFCLFPDVVDSRFTEQVDSLPDIVDSVPDFVDIFLKRLTIMKNTAVVCQAAGGAKPPKSACLHAACKVRD